MTIRSSSEPLREPRSTGTPRVLTLERALRIGLIVLAVGGAPSMILAPEGLPRLRTVERELASVERENAGVRREVEVLRARVRKLREDPATVERLARDELGLVRETEIVFQFPK